MFVELILKHKQTWIRKQDNGKDVMDTMLIESGKEVGYWLNEILTRVIDGRLKNDRENLIYWMTGITDGWIKY